MGLRDVLADRAPTCRHAGKAPAAPAQTTIWDVLRPAPAPRGQFPDLGAPKSSSAVSSAVSSAASSRPVVPSPPPTNPLTGPKFEGLTPLIRTPPGSAAPPLGNNANSLTPQAKALGKQGSSQYEGRLRDRARWLQDGRPRRCGRFRIASMVAIETDGAQAHVHGVETCGSVWACPRCGGRIRRSRADELKRAGKGWVDGGGELLMLTLTLPHEMRDRLKTLVQAVSASWSRVIAGKPWRLARERNGIEGYTRALEVTRGARHGWHPHLHILLWCKAPLTEIELRTFRDWMAARWRRAVLRELPARHAPHLQHGCDVRRTNAADYVSKTGMEVVGTSTKGSAMMATLVRATDGCARSAAAWREYAATMKGRRHLTWSHGMRDALGLNEEPTDDELANAPLEAPRRTVEMTDKLWDRLCREVGASGITEAVTHDRLAELIAERLPGRAFRSVETRGRTGAMPDDATGDVSGPLFVSMRRVVWRLCDPIKQH